MLIVSLLDLRIGVGAGALNDVCVELEEFIGPEDGNSRVPLWMLVDEMSPVFSKEDFFRTGGHGLPEDAMVVQLGVVGAS